MQPWQSVCGAIKLDLNSHFPVANTCHCSCLYLGLTHACCDWSVLYREKVQPEELSYVQIVTYACMTAQAHTYKFLYMRVHYTHIHSLKTSSSETKEERPPCVQLTE